jgi:hypothetical protein
MTAIMDHGRLAMFGGCLIPVMFMPSFVQKVSVLSPVFWCIRSFGRSHLARIRLE